MIDNSIKPLDNNADVFGIKTKKTKHGFLPFDLKNRYTLDRSWIWTREYSTCHSYRSDLYIVISNKIDRSSHLQTNRNISIYLALDFAFGYSSMPNSTLSSSC